MPQRKHSLHPRRPADVLAPGQMVCKVNVSKNAGLASRLLAPFQLRNKLFGIILACRLNPVNRQAERCGNLLQQLFGYAVKPGAVQIGPVGDDQAFWLHPLADRPV